MKTPEAVGVPLIIIVFPAHAAVTPEGKPVGVPIPVAPVVVCVIFVIAVFTQTVGADEAELTVLVNTLIVPVALSLPELKITGIE